MGSADRENYGAEKARRPPGSSGTRKNNFTYKLGGSQSFT